MPEGIVRDPDNLVGLETDTLDNDMVVGVNICTMVVVACWKNNPEEVLPLLVTVTVNADDPGQPLEGENENPVGV